MDISGTVSIVTGGNGGLGRRICHALSLAGSQIAVVYAQSRTGAEAFAEELLQSGAEATAFQCDVSEPAQVEDLARLVLEKFGRIDILINDAAYNKWIPFNDLDAMGYDEWNKMLNTNLTGPMLCIKAVAPHMKRQGRGRIVNISSTSGLNPIGSSIPYAVSKAGLIHLTKCMAVALAPEILVNCVAPGYIEGTRATANLKAEFRERAKRTTLLQRPADKDDIAKQVIALCETDSTTGQTIVIDSGKVFH